jgi:hypothetical protein
MICSTEGESNKQSSSPSVMKPFEPEYLVSCRKRLMLHELRKHCRRVRKISASDSIEFTCTGNVQNGNNKLRPSQLLMMKREVPKAAVTAVTFREGGPNTTCSTPSTTGSYSSSSSSSSYSSSSSSSYSSSSSSLSSLQHEIEIPQFSLNGDKYNQNTYYGRFQKMLDLVDPRTLFYTAQDLHNAQNTLPPKIGPVIRIGAEDNIKSSCLVTETELENLKQIQCTTMSMSSDDDIGRTQFRRW